MSAEPLPRERGSGRALRWAGMAAAALFVALLAYGLVAKAPNTTIDDALAGGRPVAAPGFELAVLEDGRPGPLGDVWRRASADGRVDLAELRGTPVVLNFWASWCIPCREEAPLLRRGWESGRDQGILFVGLDMQDVRDDALAFLRGFRLTFPNVRDPSNATARRWGVTGIPETFFIDREGRVVGHVIGVVDEDGLRRGMTAAAAGRPVGVRTGGDQRPTR